MQNHSVNTIKIAEHILQIDGFLSEEECNVLISRSEETGYADALIQTDNGPKRVEEVRNNERLLFTDFELATSLWKIAKDYAPARLGNSVAVGLNELFRFYKYAPGQAFKKHRDQSFIRNESEASYYTLLIYLNDDYTGGETVFNLHEIQPQKGIALLFLHDLEHEGKCIHTGVKYVLRTDIMYRFEE